LLISLSPRIRKPDEPRALGEDIKRNGAVRSFCKTISRAVSDFNARDGAIVCSLALQHDVALEVISRALFCNRTVLPRRPLGAALDRIAKVESRDTHE
jgi:hypothetical protein